MAIFGVIPAAGSGSRLGRSSKQLPKALVPVAGTPLVKRTVDTLLRIYSFQEIALAAPETHIELFYDLALPDSITICEGGNTRFESVMNAVRTLKNLQDDDLILIHDAARCFVSKDIVLRCIEVASECGAAIAALPSSDTLKLVDKNSLVQKTLERKSIRRAQTPQVFRWDILKKAFDQEVALATDEASLVEQYHSVRCVEGSEENIKITYPNDLLYAEFLLTRLEKTATS
jgi:2-C-methyl-D-erythritol 4-phosphate cytidylyltransferase